MSGLMRGHAVSVCVCVQHRAPVFLFLFLPTIWLLLKSQLIWNKPTLVCRAEHRVHLTLARAVRWSHGGPPQ